MSVSVLKAIDDAVSETRRLEALGFLSSDGRSATDRLRALETELLKLRVSVAVGDSATGTEEANLIRFVTDWIPDLDEPLIGLLYGITLARQAAPASGKR